MLSQKRQRKLPQVQDLQKRQPKVLQRARRYTAPPQCQISKGTRKHTADAKTENSTLILAVKPSGEL